MDEAAKDPRDPRAETLASLQKHELYAMVKGAVGLCEDNIRHCLALTAKQQAERKQVMTIHNHLLEVRVLAESASRAAAALTLKLGDDEERGG